MAEQVEDRVAGLEEIVVRDRARLVPEPDVLARAEDFESCRRWWERAATVLGELEQLDRKLIEAIRERRRRRLVLHRLRKEARGTSMKEEVWESDEMREAKRAVPEAQAAYSEAHEEVESLKKERSELARFIDRNFVALTEHRVWPDFTAPDEGEIAAEVGRPVGGWDLMPVPTSG